MVDSEILRLIGSNVREARVKQGMTQECLAELVGVHVQTIGYIEQGKYPFAVTTFAKLAQHLHTSPNRLLIDLPLPDEKRAVRIKAAQQRRRRSSFNI